MSAPPQKLASVPLEMGLGGGEALDLRFGDLRGGGAPEVVIVGSSSIGVVGLTGTDAAFYKAPVSHIQGVVLSDFDGDGKHDLILGSSGGGHPRLHVVNGTGVSIGRVAYLGEDAGALVPVGFWEDSLLCVLRERAPRSFRGIVFVNRLTLAIEARFAVPGDPTGIHCHWDNGAPLFTVSSKPGQTGMFPYLGTSDEPRYGIDASAHLIRFDGGCGVAAALPITVEATPVVGEGHFLSLSPEAEEPLLFVNKSAGNRVVEFGDQASPAESTLLLAVIDPSDGRAVAWHRQATYGAPTVRVVGEGAEQRIIVLVRETADTWRLTAFTSALETAASRAITSTRATLGPALSYTRDTEAGHVLLGTDRGLELTDMTLATVWSEPSPFPAEIAVALWGGALRVATVASGRLHLYQLPDL